MIRIIKDRDTLRKVEVNGSIITVKLPQKAEVERLRLDHTQAGPVGGAATLLPSYFTALEQLAIRGIEPFGDEDSERAFTPDDVRFLDELTEGAVLRLLGSPAEELSRRVKGADGVYREPVNIAPPSVAEIIASLPDEAAEKKASGDGTEPG